MHWEATSCFKKYCIQGQDQSIQMFSTLAEVEEWALERGQHRFKFPLYSYQLCQPGGAIFQLKFPFMSNRNSSHSLFLIRCCQHSESKCMEGTRCSPLYAAAAITMATIIKVIPLDGLSAALECCSTLPHFLNWTHFCKCSLKSFPFPPLMKTTNGRPFSMLGHGNSKQSLLVSVIFQALFWSASRYPVSKWHGRKSAGWSSFATVKPDPREKAHQQKSWQTSGKWQSWGCQPIWTWNFMELEVP